MFKELIAVLGTIMSTFTVHIRSMAVSNFFTTVGLMDNGAMTLALGMVRSSRNLALLLEYKQEINLDATIDITLVALLVFLHYLLPS